VGKVLVKKAARTVFPISGGPPVMMLGGGGGGGSRGRTFRERAGGALGGLVGVAGALTGQHRSLGGLTNAMVSGGATGSQLGSALGRKFVGRRGQARADLREAGKQASAERDAKMMEATRSRGQGMGSKYSPFAAVRRKNFIAGGLEDDNLRQVTQMHQAVAATRAAQDKENKRMGVAVRQGMYRDAGRGMGEEARRYEEMGRKVEEMVPNFVQGMDSVDAAMQQAQNMTSQNKIGLLNTTATPPPMGANSQLIDQDVKVVNNPENYDDETDVYQAPQGNTNNMMDPNRIRAAERMAERAKKLVDGMGIGPEQLADNADNME